jgi:hypothetical protein
VAWWVGRRRGEPQRGDWSEALTLVGISFGFLLGLLQIFVVNHYRDTRVETDTEATTLVRTYDDLGAFPQQARKSAQHDLVCYMRSIIEEDWQRQEQGNLTQAPETVIFGDRLRGLRRTLPTSSQLSLASSSCCSWPARRCRRSCGSWCSSAPQP